MRTDDSNTATDEIPCPECDRSHEVHSIDFIDCGCGYQANVERVKMPRMGIVQMMLYSLITIILVVILSEVILYV